jgi:hypothetical protein
LSLPLLTVDPHPELLVPGPGPGAGQAFGEQALRRPNTQVDGVVLDFVSSMALAQASYLVGLLAQCCPGLETADKIGRTGQPQPLQSVCSEAGAVALIADNQRSAERGRQQSGAGGGWKDRAATRERFGQ